MRSDPGWKPCPEELILYGLLMLIGAIPVVIALAQQTAFGVEATIGIVMACAGLLGALDLAWRALFRCRE